MLTYTVSATDDDGSPLSDTETVTVTITGTNDEQILAVNTGVTVLEGSTNNVVTSAMLRTSDIDNTAGQLTYTITSGTANGTIRRSGTALALGGSFTQADINAGLITYDHNGSETSSDSFVVSVDDGLVRHRPALSA